MLVRRNSVGRCLLVDVVLGSGRIVVFLRGLWVFELIRCCG
jgi:hypothetical protein